MKLLIIQTLTAINLRDKSFPSQFLTEQGFPELPFFNHNGEAIQASNLLVYETRSTYSSGSSVLGQLSEGDRLEILKWCQEDKLDVLYQEYLDSLPTEEPTPDPLPDSPNWNDFSTQAADSILFDLVESSNNQTSLNLLTLIIGLINNFGLQNDPKTLAENGRLQKRLQNLIGTINDVNLPIAIAQFNSILKDTLNVEWILV